MILTRLRRFARRPAAGFTAAGGGVAEGLPFPRDPIVDADAEVVEGRTLASRRVGGPEESGFSAFLDGVQRTRVACYHGPVPVVWAFGGAVVRGRSDRAPVTAATPAGPLRRESDAVFFPFRLLEPAVVEATVGIGREVMHDTGPPAPEPLPLFPPALYALAHQAVNRWRESLEREVAERWCREAAGGALPDDDAGPHLLVDGSLTASPELASHPRTVGVVKSHNTRFFPGEEERVVLGLREGERTSVFRPGTRTFTPVYSWYLRLRAPEGRDPVFGLIRVEAAATPRTVERADRISRWLLAERAPLSLPDGRWDRLLYPIRDCEVYLRARTPAW